MKPLQRVLVIKLSSVGDFVSALPAMQRIREAHREARITLLTTPPFEMLGRASPFFNAVDPYALTSGAGEILGLIGRVRSGRYERIYDLENNAATNLLFQGLRPFPPAWSGTAVGCALPHRNPQRMKMHPLERRAEQLRDAGIWPDAPVEPGSAPPPDLSWIMKKAQPQASSTRPYVVLAPGGSEAAPDQRWPAEKFAELAVHFDKEGYDVIVVGGPQESALARVIQRRVSRTRDLTGRTDFAQIAVIGVRSALVVGNATGAVHLMAAAGAPTICLLPDGADPQVEGPRGHVTLVQGPMADIPMQTVAHASLSLLPRPAQT